MEGKTTWDITLNLNYKALVALANLVDYASKDISLDDEPLLDELSKMLEVRRLQYEPTE